ncbi:N-acetylmuramoyl-L-alanine amidase [Fodinibius sp.]|uniref:N-acetylmuramoyl-L-alanine amidase family protein n=1 Tax=Fodinibius sp. TaxID=1872440 RepID=UPI002ACEC642|nr:N-acetylmuramoyl-L-alanine amidase [Fodinibius sp.]MDZ7657862.1 N-acetylmuramoyl-L-alanine amidase [Fodinibius sp.]
MKCKVIDPILKYLNSHSKCGHFWSLLAICLFLSFGLSQPLQAQDNSLQMVSTAERSDGKGQVIRFHLKQPVDSFQVYQPDVDLIQMTLYQDNIDTTDIELPNISSAFDEISFYDIPDGIGIDIYITEGKFYDGKAYHDGNSDDLLLGLTEVDKTELEYLTKDTEPIIWSSFTITEKDLLEGNGNYESTDYNETRNKMKFDVVVIDPGHGGHDPGSIGHRNVKEKHIVLDIAKKVGGYINEYMPNVKVVYTRETDKFIELEERGSIANEAEGDLFISIHCNSHSSRQPYGTELFFLGLERSESALEVMKRENKVVRPNNDTEQRELSQEELLVYELANSSYIAASEQIAGMMEYQFDERAQRHSRGVKQGRFVVLYHASMPAVLVETGFISNPSEARYLTSERGQAYIASAIFRAIRNYKEGNSNP